MINNKDQIIDVNLPEQVQKVQMVHKKPVLIGYKVTVVYKKQGQVDCMFVEGTNTQKYCKANQYYKHILLHMKRSQTKHK